MVPRPPHSGPPLGLTEPARKGTDLPASDGA